MSCKRCFMIINLRMKGFSFFLFDWPLSGTRRGCWNWCWNWCWNRSQLHLGHLIQGPMWAVGQVTLLKGTLAMLWRCPGIQQHLPENHPGSFHRPYNFYYDSHANQPINWPLCTCGWASVVMAAMVPWRPKCRENRSPHVNVTTMQPLTV